MTLQQATLNAWRLPRGRGLQSSNQNNHHNINTSNNINQNSNNINENNNTNNHLNRSNITTLLRDSSLVNNTQLLETNGIQNLDVTIPILILWV